MTARNYWPRGRNIALIIFLVIIVLLTPMDKLILRSWFSRTAYWFILSIFGVWIWTILQLLAEIRFKFRSFWQRHKGGVLGAVLLTILTVVSVKPEFRTLSDETNLLAVSKSMASNKTVYNVTMGKWYFDNFNGINFEVPKRPLGYPFLVHLVHLGLGYRPGNGFVLNAMVLFFLLLGVFVATRNVFDVKVGLAAMLLVLSQPVVSLSACSSGYDLLSLLFFYLSIGALAHYLKRPSAKSLAYLWMSLVVFAQVRYESFIFILLTIFFLLLIKRLHWSHLKTHSSIYFATPLWAVMTIWQRVLSVGTYENPAGQGIFSLANCWRHLKDVLGAQTNIELYLPYATVWLWVGVVATVVGIPWLFLSKKRWALVRPRLLLLFILGCMATSFVIVNAHFIGSYTHPVSARLFLPIILFLTLMPVFLLRFFPGFPRVILVWVAFGIFTSYHSVTMENRFINTLTIIRRTKFVHQELKKIGHNNILVIADRPGQYTVMNYGAVNFQHARANSELLIKELRRRLYRDIIVVQEISYETGEPNLLTALPQEFELDTHSELQYTSDHFVRLSKVVYD